MSGQSRSSSPDAASRVAGATNPFFARLRPASAVSSARVVRPTSAPSTSRRKSAGAWRNGWTMPIADGRRPQGQSRPQSAQDISTKLSFLSAKEEGAEVAKDMPAQILPRRSVPDPPPGGLCGILLASLKGTEPTDAMDLRLLEATVMRVAPSNCILPCSLGVCCWRWAARQLLHECALARADASAVRLAFEEEVGHSVLQKLLDLQHAHQELKERHDATAAALKKWQNQCDATEKQCREEHAARERAQALQARAEETQKQFSNALTKANAKLQEAEEELHSLRATEGVASLKHRLESSEARCEEIAAQGAAEVAKMKSELDRATEAAAAMGVRLKQLEAVEETLLQSRRAARRDKK